MGKQKIGIFSRRETFAACHRLHSPHLSDSENREIYGKCNHPNGHGHNYVLEVLLRGPISSTTGMIFNASELKEIIKKHVLQHVDHRNLDLDVDFFKQNASTTENLAVYIWNQLKDNIPNNLLYQIKIHETENNVAIYQGEEE